MTTPSHPMTSTEQKPGTTLVERLVNWPGDGQALREEAASVILSLQGALEPFAADKLPSTKKTLIDYDQHGLRRLMSPMEVAVKKAVATLRALSSSEHI